MGMPLARSIEIVCPNCSHEQFEVSILKEEGVGVIKCLQCGRDYLLLDSADFWFDVIQQRPYPRPMRCGCKGTAFRLTIDYKFRDDGDVGSVAVRSTCAACVKTRRQFGAEIDYHPTKQLVDEPVTFCKNPKVQYDLRQLTLYATRADIAGVARFLRKDAGCQFAGSTRLNGEWSVRNLDFSEAEQIILNDTGPSCCYRWIYAFDAPIEISANAVDTARTEAAFWKRQEVIRISFPTNMLFDTTNRVPSLLYYIRFSNEYVEKERVVAKSQRFLGLTGRLIEWLHTEFVTWRGANCFDNEQEHLRAFGNRFRSAAEKKSRRT
jgi:hypothetical protein